MSVTKNIEKALKSFDLKQLAGHRDVWLIVGGIVAFILIGYQLSLVPLWKIGILLVGSYLVDFSLSKIKYVGDIGAAMINFVLALLFIPTPASIAIGLMLAYFSAKPDIGLGITLPLGQIALISMWMLSKMVF